MRSLLALAFALALACAGGRIPLGDPPIDWEGIGERWSLHIVTRDPDGDERVTRVWLATLDGVGTLRTGESRWARNLKADPHCRLRVRGVDYATRAEFVTEREQRVRIDLAFREKYGWQERLLFWEEPGETHDHYLRLR